MDLEILVNLLQTKIPRRFLVYHTIAGSNLETTRPASLMAEKNSRVEYPENIISAGKTDISMPDNFEFDHTFNVQSFTLVIKRGFNEFTYESNSAELTDEMKAKNVRINHGQEIVFNIIVEFSLKSS